MLNDWKPFLVIKATEINSHESQNLYYTILRSPSYQDWIMFEGDETDCQEECNALNIRIHSSLSEKILK